MTYTKSFCSENAKKLSEEINTYARKRNVKITSVSMIPVKKLNKDRKFNTVEAIVVFEKQEAANENE
jgi:CRISPR/Cas system endoribonuclease Cas6 (RAMP superfamily)